MNTWEIAFTVLQIIFTISISAVILVLRAFYNDIKNFRTEIDTKIVNVEIRVRDLEAQQGIENERYQFILKNLDSINKMISKLFTKIDEMGRN